MRYETAQHQLHFIQRNPLVTVVAIMTKISSKSFAVPVSKASVAYSISRVAETRDRALSFLLGKWNS